MKGHNVKTKTKSNVNLVTVTAAIQIPKDGWKEEATRPEEVKEEDLDSSVTLADMFVLYHAPVQVFCVCRALFDLHYEMFIQRESLMGRRYPKKYWPVIPLEARRKIYRDVGLMLGYDF